MNLILDLLFPKRCVGCLKFNTYLCKECISNIKQADLVCPQCQRLAIGGQTHPICRRKYSLDGLWSLGVYQDPLRLIIKKLKYNWVKDIANVLVNILIEYWAVYHPFVLDEIKKTKGEGWIVTPVPLYWWRENERGFNQASLIAKKLAENLSLEYKVVLKRVHYTKSQTKFKGKERRKNVFNAFAIDSSAPTGINYLLIDDVWTTGFTLKECCFVLKRGGAKKVWALTLAK